ncbi:MULTISPECIES: hypothetical protein [unclassified Rhizobium]|uniref:hypothetical protein n=1 Tax=unclassified Rhizobium TaxID=2613769 RepID=UPI0017865C82|nr:MULTISPECIES: hypothetical protein [unclassified Rhizobium]MBD8687058.1 hypothetical protein [Rhizobium sp. CFBP 13644]MBD8691139.1 hypothetical protein [Rhizobium sp. CFBP 13717]
MRLPVTSLHAVLSMIATSYVKALAGAVSRHELTQEQALKITDNANHLMPEGIQTLPKE